MNPITATPPAPVASPELESTFKRVVGGIFYGQLLKSLRETVGKPAYIHGGQAEELFQSQLDQYVVDDLAGRQGGPWMDALLQQFLVQLNQRGGPAAQPAQLHQSEQSVAPSPLAELAKAARQTQPASEDVGMRTGTAALSALIRK